MAPDRRLPRGSRSVTMVAGVEWQSGFAAMSGRQREEEHGED